MITQVPIVLRRKARHAGTGRPPLLMLLHGRGADEHDLFGLAPFIDPAFAVVSVRGPLTTDEGGYTWAESRSVGRADPDSLRAAITWLQTWLDANDEGRSDPQRVYLMGFSAGMAMASALMLDEPGRFAGAILLSGTLPFDTDLSITKHRLADCDVFYGHGSFDTVIPADLVERTDAYLRERSGARLTAKRYPIAHQISDAEIADIGAWLAACEQRAAGETDAGS